MITQFAQQTAGVLSLALYTITVVAAQTTNNQPSAAESRFLGNTRQLTYEGRRAGEGYFSPDGSRLIFQSEREPGNPFYQIYILNLKNGDTHRVSPGQGKTTCAFFRGGTDEVLFASTHHDPDAEAKQKAELEFRASGKERRYSWDYDDQMEIYAARSDGSGLRRLTTAPGYDAEAAYSPDGRKIVFTSLRNAYPKERLSAEEQRRIETDPSWFAEIYIMNADGSNSKRLTSVPGYDGGPFFSPDGRRIIWRRFDEKGVNADVYTMRIDGSDVRRLTDFQAMSWAPYFHPSGRYVVFTANKLGFANFELFIVDSDGAKEPVRVTYTDGFDGLPVFAPNGRQLCWTSSRTADNKSQLFLADWNHEAALAAIREAPQRGSAPATVRTSTPSAAAPPVAATPALKPPKVGRLSPDIRQADLRQQVSFLASDALEGRQTGSRGNQFAAQFLADQLQRDGLKPALADGSWFQKFQFTSGIRVLTNESQLLVTRSSDVSGPVRFEVEKDFRPFSFTSNGKIEGDVVFAGYGLSVPGKPGEGYDSYSGLDVSNRIVIVLRFVPESVDAARRQELNRYAGLRYKAMIAREHGAKALLVITGPNSPNAGELVPMTYDSSSSGSDIIAASISGQLAKILFEAANKDLKAIQSQLDTENPHAETGFGLNGVRLNLSVAVEQIRSEDRNVLAQIAPDGQAGNAAEYIVVGAHYDHLGFGKEGSLQQAGEEGTIHNGADDNASGTAVVLELAASLAAERKRHPSAFRRGVIFALWSGEEIGLIGSSHFAEHPPFALSNVVACVNFDMVGRLRDNRLVLQGVGSSSSWRRSLEQRNVASGFQLVLQEDPYLPTDVTSFYPKGIPVLNFFTGSHSDYHRPTDDADKINYEGLERIGRFARDLVFALAQQPERPDYVKVARSERPGGSRDNLRAYLGTIPDYATEVAGVKLSGVRGGSPAEKGGLQGGDVIVEFDGKKIANIYDYTYALDAVRIGRPVDVVVQRAGERVRISVVPEARK